MTDQLRHLPYVHVIVCIGQSVEDKTCLRSATNASSIYWGSMTRPYMSAMRREHSSLLEEFISRAMETQSVSTSPMFSGPVYNGLDLSGKLIA